MSAAPRPADEPVSDPDAEYFQAIEEFFVSRRGDPLFLSNADWVMIRGWREAGFPLRVVLRGISDAMDSHEVSWSRQRKVGSLRYCAPEVEEAAARWRKALAGGHEETQLGGVLLRLAAALAASESLGVRARAVANRLVPELHDRAHTDAPGDALEAWLRAGESELLAAIAGDAPADENRMLEEEVDRDLAAYRERLPPKVLAQVRDESLARRRLEAHGLVRMSLWAL